MTKLYIDIDDTDYCRDFSSDCLDRRMVYDHTKCDEMKRIAISSVDEFKVGETYYVNTYPDKFVFVKIISGADIFLRHNPNFQFDNDADRKRWEDVKVIVGQIEVMWSGKTKMHECTLHATDHNIGASYNPWFIFDTEEKCARCKEELNSTIRWE